MAFDAPQRCSNTGTRGPFVVVRSGCKLRYWLAGTRGPALVCTHGFTMDHGVFDELIGDLCTDHRVLTWDVRGHGLSKPMGAFSISRCADDLRAILDDAELDGAYHLGHSMGGHIVQELAFREPSRIRGMIMVSSTCLTWRAHAVQSAGGPLTHALLRVWPHRWTTAQIGWIAGMSHRARANASRAAAFMSKQERAAVWQAVVSSHHHEPAYRVACPMLILVGQYDVVVGAGLIRALAPSWAARERARLLIVPGAGHNAHEDNPSFTRCAIRSLTTPATGPTPA